MKKLAAIVGPTASGKSAAALTISTKLQIEIVSCDSMQVYRGMDIGTAKASHEERQAVKHHCLDMVEVNSEFNVADYQKAAKVAIDDANERNAIPVLVGGTGLYYQSVVDDYDFFPLPNLAEVRRSLEHECDRIGLPAMYERLCKVDAAYSQRISPQDRKRIIRALEIWEITGSKFSSMQKKQSGRYRLAVAGIDMPRSMLYEQINQRVDQMLENGLLDEVKALMLSGAESYMTSMQALGYKQALAYLKGNLDYPEMVQAIKTESRRYAKRQYTWFKKDDRIKWFEIGEGNSSTELADKICEYIESTLNSG